jgi:DNA-binding PadR family transcriptional regulator
MNSISSLGKIPISTSILADEIVEFHAARLLLLVHLCGTNGKIDGLTKMAKLDFFVRYPKFFSLACQRLGVAVKSPRDTVESNMVRFHYGPWDHRYYQILTYLKARGLLEYTREGRKVMLTLTEAGRSKASALENTTAFQLLTAQMHLVRDVLSKKSGTQLKNLVYETFDKEVAQLDLGEVIK